jgi:hypothetical protein
MDTAEAFKIADNMSANHSYEEIAKHLTKEGFRNRNGKPMTEASLWYFLNRSKYSEEKRKKATNLRVAPNPPPAREKIASDDDEPSEAEETLATIYGIVNLENMSPERKVEIISEIMEG